MKASPDDRSPSRQKRAVTSDRHQRIIHHFSGELPSSLFNLAFLDRRQWEAAESSLDHLHRPFGFIAPQKEGRPDPEGVYAMYWVLICPELMAETMEPLTDEAQEQLYLNAVSLHLLGHVAHWDAPADTIEALIDDDLWQRDKANLRVTSEVMMRYRDRLAHQA